MGSREIAWIVAGVALVAASLSGCVDRQFQLNTNPIFSEALDARVSEIVTDPSPGDCLQPDRPCVFVGGASNLPNCPIFEKVENCIAVSVRASLLDDVAVRAVIERESAEFCSYRREPVGTENFPTTISRAGCVSPGSEFSLVYRAQPTICVVVLGGGVNGVTEVFAVRGGQRVRHPWCDRVDVDKRHT